MEMKSSINEMKNALESTENSKGPLEEIIQTQRWKSRNDSCRRGDNKTKFCFVFNEQTMRTIYIRKGNIKIMGIPEERRKREQRTFKEIITEFSKPGEGNGCIHS